MPEQDFVDRVEAWAHQRPERVAGINPWLLIVRLGRESIDDRVPGLAAEMAFFALLSLVPLLVALGAALGFLERVVGSGELLRAQAAVISGLAAVFSQDVTDDFFGPLVRGLLAEERTGVALGGLAVALWLSSRVFTATIRALDQAYDIEDRRNMVVQRLLAILFALGSVIAVALTLMLMIVGPLLGGGQALARLLGLGDTFTLLWQYGRWPLILVVLIGFLTVLYRFGPNIRNTWVDCLPGAVLGVVLWMLIAVGFRVYLAAGGDPTGTVPGEDVAVQRVARVVGALVATVLWTYLSGMALLIGGEFNAELARMKAQDPEAT